MRIRLSKEHSSTCPSNFFLSPFLKRKLISNNWTKQHECLSTGILFSHYAEKMIEYGMGLKQDNIVKKKKIKKSALDPILLIIPSLLFHDCCWKLIFFASSFSPSSRFLLVRWEPTTRYDNNTSTRVDTCDSCKRKLRNLLSPPPQKKTHKIQDFASPHQRSQL